MRIVFGDFFFFYKFIFIMYECIICIFGIFYFHLNIRVNVFFLIIFESQLITAFIIINKYDAIQMHWVIYHFNSSILKIAIEVLVSAAILRRQCMFWTSRYPKMLKKIKNEMITKLTLRERAGLDTAHNVLYGKNAFTN